MEPLCWLTQTEEDSAFPGRTCSRCQLPSEPTVRLALGLLDTHKLRAARATHFKRFFLWMATSHSDSFGDYSETVISRAARHVLNYDGVRFPIAFPCKHWAVRYLCSSPSAFKEYIVHRFLTATPPSAARRSWGPDVLALDVAWSQWRVLSGLKAAFVFLLGGWMLFAPVIISKT